MKKIALLLAVILAFSAPITVSAATRALTIHPYLGFDGTTATCEVTVVGNNMSERIDVEMKLMHGSTCIDSWSITGYGYVYTEKFATVTKGLTYDLVVAVSINGVAHTPVSVTGAC